MKNIKSIINQMEATLELWKNWKGGYKDSYLEFREEDIKIVYDCIKKLEQDNKRLNSNEKTLADLLDKEQKKKTYQNGLIKTTQ